MKKKKRSTKKPQIKCPTMLENRMNHTLSDLPPTNFSVHPRDFEENKLWLKIHRCYAAAIVVKSWLPTPTRRCGGPHQLPQLRRVVSGIATPQSERPTPLTRKHFLGGSDSILEALESREEDYYWCILERSATKKKEKKPKPQANEDDDLGPKLRSYSVGLGPCSGLTVTVNYEEPRFYSSYRSGGSWSVSKYASIRYEFLCAVSDPFDARRRPMEFADGVIRRGDKYYAVTLQGAVVAMEVIDTRLRITAVGSMRAVPSPRSSSRFFKEYFMEVEGEILLVYLIHESVEVVDDVEVFRLDLDKLDLIKVERMQGRTMFLKESWWEWVWVDSAEFGCRDNCVFFTEGKENNKWRVYDFKKCCISSV